MVILRTYGSLRFIGETIKWRRARAVRSAFHTGVYRFRRDDRGDGKHVQGPQAWLKSGKKLNANSDDFAPVALAA